MDINNSFNSEINKNAIKSIINEKVIEKYNYKINNDYDNMINETMAYVLSQVSSKPPKGVSNQEYLFLMNKKVYDLVYPVIDKNVILLNKKKVFSNIENKNKIIDQSDKKMNISINDNLFDPILVKNYETQALMDYPKPGATKISDEVTTMQMKKIESDRSTLTPKLKPIDFSIKTNNEDKGITMKMYNELLTSYTKENELLDYNNDSTPIQLLKTLDDNNNDNNNDDNINKLLQNLENNLSLQNNIETFSNKKEIYDGVDDFKKFLDNNNFNNDLNTYTINQIPNLEFSGTLQKSPVLLEPNFNLVEKKYFVIFDSKDRDLELYPLQVSFQVKFAPTTNNFIYNSYYDKYNTLILAEKEIVYATNTEINIQETFDNIKSIKCTYSSVPSNVIYYNNVSPRSIYSEPYVYLVVPEIQGPYRGGNSVVSKAFSKLGVDESSNTSNNIVNSLFTTLICNHNEVFLYNPVSNGKIDKMTLQMYNKYGNLYNFGIDKLYIQSFEEGEYIYNGYCGEKYISTKITIQSKNNNYASYCAEFYNNNECNILNSHPVNEGNKIYFYNILPNQDQTAFLEDNIYISKLKYNVNNTVNIYLSYKKIIDNKEKNINVVLKDIIPGGNNNDPLLFKDYYIVIYDKNTNKYYYLSIVTFTNTYTVVDTLGLPNFNKYNNLKIGIAKKNLRGNNDFDKNSLFSAYGYIVTSLDNENIFKITINYPYNNLPKYIKDGYYEDSSIFFIQDKMQISYNFEITTMVKDYINVNSKLNESGNN